MSRIGKTKIQVPNGVNIDLKGNHIKVTGPKGALDMDIHPGILVKVEDGALEVTNQQPELRAMKALHGTMRSLINNMVIGVSTGYSKSMQIFGTGYNIKEQGGKVILSVGYCHTVEMPLPKGITIDIKTPATRGNDVPAEFLISGTDKQLLGQFAAEVRSKKPPEPYKGKGIRYADEHVRRKVGKAFGA